MSRERDQRVLVGLVRKAQDPGIPVAERQAFRAKAEEIHHRLAARGAPQVPGAESTAKQNAPANKKPETPAPKEPETAPSEPVANAPRMASKARRWRPIHGLLACTIGIGLGLFLQNNPGAAMVVIGLGIAVAALCAPWMRKSAAGKLNLGEAAG